MVLDCTRGRGVQGSARNNVDLEREETERREPKLRSILRELASLRFFSLVEKSNEVRARRASVHREVMQTCVAHAKRASREGDVASLYVARRGSRASRALAEWHDARSPNTDRVFSYEPKPRPYGAAQIDPTNTSVLSTAPS